VVAVRRSDGAALIEKEWDCDCIVLDDAFQHRAIARNLDLVLADSLNPFGNGRLLPAGPCREPLSSFRRAHIIMMTHVDQASQLDAAHLRIKKFSDAPLFHSSHTPTEWICWPEGKTVSLDALAVQNVLAFAGLGNPEGFIRTLQSLNLKSADLIRFGDHHWYTCDEMDQLTSAARDTGAECLITTEKDALRIPEGYKSRLPIYALRIDIAILEPIGLLDRLIECVFKANEE